MAWVLIIAGALAVAVFTFVTATAASAANDAWQESVRAETRHTHSTMENIRTLYEDEAPIALLISAALIRAEELGQQAGPAGQDSFVRTAVAAERATARAYFDQFRKNAPDSPINNLITTGGDPAGTTGAQRIGRRLAALQEQSGQHAVASAALQKAGDQSAERTQRSAIGMIAGALVALLGFLLWSRTDGHAGVLLRDTWTAVKPPHHKAPVPKPDTTGDEPTVNPSNGAGSDSEGDGIVDADAKAADRPENGTHDEEAPAAVIGAPALPAPPPEGPPKQSRSPLPAVIFAVLA